MIVAVSASTEARVSSRSLIPVGHVCVFAADYILCDVCWCVPPFSPFLRALIVHPYFAFTITFPSPSPPPYAPIRAAQITCPPCLAAGLSFFIHHERVALLRPPPFSLSRRLALTNIIFRFDCPGASASMTVCPAIRNS
jgi:hypothetical protein